ncbi:MAG: hypothetical protein ACTHJR_18130 [Sphingomonas sp.]|uniref:hypothetical protein n=1 Tax=Sphingomonas sp. TaxID=28214 RepID=UPI003F7E888D
MAVANIQSGKTITVVADFKPHVIAETHPNYTKIKQMVNDPATTEAQILPLLDIPKAIETFTGNLVQVKNGKLYYKGFEVRNSLAQTILRFVHSGDEAAAGPLKLLMEKVQQNPDPRVRDDLYDWLVAAKLPITPDGDVLAWKAVREDYRSIHSPHDERFDHRPGNFVEQDRSECDPNPNQTCSSGLHFCAADYLREGYRSGGNRLVIVKINPEDIVAFPNDYHLRKGRAAKYQVVGEIPFEQINEYYDAKKVVHTAPLVTTPQPKPTTSRFAVGQVWTTRDRRQVRITRIAKGYIYTDGTPRLKSNGSQHGIGIFSGDDLITFVK